MTVWSILRNEKKDYYAFSVYIPDSIQAQMKEAVTNVVQLSVEN